jgi:hypothetical protein
MRPPGQAAETQTNAAGSCSISNLTPGDYEVSVSANGFNTEECHAAKGKGVGHAGQCNFLIAAPVKSFDSGHSNRDLHMLQATRDAEFPMIVVRTQFPESAIASGTIHADLEVRSRARPPTISKFQLRLERRERAGEFEASMLAMPQSARRGGQYFRAVLSDAQAHRDEVRNLPAKRIVQAAPGSPDACGDSSRRDRATCII